MASTSTSKPKRSETLDTILFLVKLFVIVVIFRSFIFSPFSIPSESMLPRLYVGDYLFVSKWNYGFSRWSMPFGVANFSGKVLSRVPTRGDVVVFRAPVVLDHDVIKRVIGLPGDTVQMTHGTVILNGTAIPKDRVADFTIPVTPNYHCDPQYQDIAAGKPICRYKRYRETLPGGRSYFVLDWGDFPDRDDTALYTVPAGHVFVMGDNRDDSGDSRFPPPLGMGYVPLENIEGKALVSFFSTDGTASGAPSTWLGATRWSRIGEGF